MDVAAAVAAEAFADAISSGWSPSLGLLGPSETLVGAGLGLLQLFQHLPARLTAAAAVAACEAGSMLLQSPVPEVGTDQDGPGASLLVVAVAAAVLRAGDGTSPAPGVRCCVLGSSAVFEPLMKPCPVQKAAGAAEVAFLASALPLP